MSETPVEGANSVAILQGAGVDPSEAARCLAPGGWLYWEAEERPTLRSAGAALDRATRQLGSGGLNAAGIWAVWPSFDRNDVYVPGDALGWFARTMYPSRTFEERVRRAALRVLAPLGPASGALITPCFALTAVAGPVPRAVKPVVFTHGVERVTVLAFPPTSLLKIPRQSAFNGKTVREQEVLAQIRSRLRPGTARALPEPKGIIRYGEIVAGVESYAPGRSMVLDHGRESDLRLATDWLTQFHLETMRGREPWSGDLIADAFAAWMDRMEATSAEKAVFDLARARSDELCGVDFPVVWQHRDFTPWNLLRNGRGELKVLDWEGAEPGPALCDLLHFVGHWDEIAAGAVTHEERLRAFVRGAPASRRAVARYCARLGIDLRFVPLLLVYTRVEIALRNPGRTFDARYVEALAECGPDLFPA